MCFATVLRAAHQRLRVWAPGQTAVFADKGIETGSEQNITHSCVLMRAGGVLSRYLVKTHHHKSDIFALRELEGASQRSHNQKGPRAEISLSRVWFSFRYTSHWLHLLHQNVPSPLVYLALFHVE